MTSDILCHIKRTELYFENTKLVVRLQKEGDIVSCKSKHNFVRIVADSICVDMVRHHADVVGDMVVGDDDCGVSSAVFDFVFLGGVGVQIFAQKVLDMLTDMKARC